MEDTEAQSILQVVTVAAIILAVLVGGYTYLTQGAADWRQIWVMIFLVTLPGLIHIYLEQN